MDKILLNFHILACVTFLSFSLYRVSEVVQFLPGNEEHRKGRMFLFGFRDG